MRASWSISRTLSSVGIVSGGGSGHEPLHAGFVGFGMLDAACPGDVFAVHRPETLAEWASAYFDDGFLTWPKYDPAETTKLLAEAGYKGEPITIQTNTRYQGMYDNSVIVQAMLTAAGINAKLETLDWATQLDNYNNDRPVDTCP